MRIRLHVLLFSVLHQTSTHAIKTERDHPFREKNHVF